MIDCERHTNVAVKDIDGLQGVAGMGFLVTTHCKLLHSPMIEFIILVYYPRRVPFHVVKLFFNKCCCHGCKI